MTKAKVAKGTKLQRGDGAATEVFTTIAEVLSFSGPGATLPTADATSFDSAAAESVAGVPDNGEVSFELQFIGSDTGHQGLKADLRAATLRNFKLLINDKTLDADKTTFEFSAYVTAFSLNGGGPNEKYTASVTLKISGEVTETYAAA